MTAPYILTIVTYCPHDTQHNRCHVTKIDVVAATERAVDTISHGACPDAFFFTHVESDQKTGLYFLGGAVIAFEDAPERDDLRADFSLHPFLVMTPSGYARPFGPRDSVVDEHGKVVEWNTPARMDYRRILEVGPAQAADEMHARRDKIIQHAIHGALHDGAKSDRFVRRAVDEALAALHETPALFSKVVRAVGAIGATWTGAMVDYLPETHRCTSCRTYGAHTDEECHDRRPLCTACGINATCVQALANGYPATCLDCFFERGVRHGGRAQMRPAPSPDPA